MNTYATQMGSEMRGALNSPPLSVPCRGPMEAQLEELKERLLQPLVKSAADSVLIKEIVWAANEAAALAWYTACPVLFLPDLLEEKVRGALQRWEKQEQILRHQAGDWWAEATRWNPAS